MRLTEKLVDQIQKISYEDINESAGQIVRFAVLDSVGSALAASKTTVGKKYIALSEDEYGGTSKIWGTKVLTTLNLASFVNSFLAQTLDFDDTYEIKTLAVTHPGPAIVPLALTMGQAFDISARDLIRSIVLGYELCMRFSNSIEPRDDSYFGFSNSQVIGAVTASAILMGLKREEFVNALGLAVSTSPVANTKGMWSLEKRPMAWVKDGVGFVVFNALMCSKMARLGFISTREGLDPENEFYKICGASQYKTEEMLREIGKYFLIEKISFKPYPTCRFMQSTLDAISRIISEKSINHTQVYKIQIFLTPYLAKSFDEKSPPNLIDAQFSLPYAATMVLLKKEPSPEWYEPSLLDNNPVVKKIMKKIEIIADDDVEKKRKEESQLKIKIKIFLNDNTEFFEEAGIAKGHPDNPFTQFDHEKKFKNALAPFFKKQKIDRVMNLILGMNSDTKISEIVAEI